MQKQFSIRPAGGDGEREFGRTADEFSPLRTVALLDTAAASTNLGDQIIMEAVRHELADIVRQAAVLTLTSHEWMGRHSRGLLRQADFAIAGGTNLLNSHMWFRPSWKVNPLDAFRYGRVILMGVGWYQYQRAPDPYSRWILRSLLSTNHLHSVREGYAVKMLARIGVRNVVNTGCPTIWALTPEHCAQLPQRKAPDVVTAINSHPGQTNPEADRRMLDILRQQYRTVYLWIQTHTDYEYVRQLGNDGIRFVDPSLRALDSILTSTLEVDYVGNRLHAGIRAIQKGRRAVIMEIDNRAKEMGQDFGLPTVSRLDFERLSAMIAHSMPISVTPPREAIARWKSQFFGGGEQAGAP